MTSTDIILDEKKAQNSLEESKKGIIAFDPYSGATI